MRGRGEEVGVGRILAAFEANARFTRQIPGRGDSRNTHTTRLKV